MRTAPAFMHQVRNNERFGQGGCRSAELLARHRTPPPFNGAEADAERRKLLAVTGMWKPTKSTNRAGLFEEFSSRQGRMPEDVCGREGRGGGKKAIRTSGRSLRM